MGPETRKPPRRAVAPPGPPHIPSFRNFDWIMNRMGSISSTVGPAVTSIFSPAEILPDCSTSRIRATMTSTACQVALPLPCRRQACPVPDRRNDGRALSESRHWLGAPDDATSPHSLRERSIQAPEWKDRVSKENHPQFHARTFPVILAVAGTTASN